MACTRHRGARRPGHLRQRRSRRALPSGPRRRPPRRGPRPTPSSPRCTKRSATCAATTRAASDRAEAAYQAVRRLVCQTIRRPSAHRCSRSRWVQGWLDRYSQSSTLITRGLRALDDHRRPRRGGTATGAPPRLVRAVLPSARPHHALTITLVPHRHRDRGDRVEDQVALAARVARCSTGRRWTSGGSTPTTNLSRALEPLRGALRPPPARRASSTCSAGCRTAGRVGPGARTGTERALDLTGAPATPCWQAFCSMQHRRDRFRPRPARRGRRALRGGAARRGGRRATASRSPTPRQLRPASPAGPAATTRPSGAVQGVGSGVAGRRFASRRPRDAALRLRRVPALVFG